MKKIVLTFFAVIGVIFTLVIVSLIGLAIRQQGNSAQALPDEIILNLRIQDSLKEVNEPASILNPFTQTPLTVPQIVQSIDQAATDSRVKVLTLYLKSGNYGLGQLQEVRDAVTRFRDAGKFTLIYAETLGDGPAMGSYYLASAFDQIWLQPIGELAITGVSAEMPFGRDLLQKIGVQPQILHRGRYKSYPEMLMRNGMSDDNRTMMTSLLSNIYHQFASTMAKSRHITGQQMQTAINNAPLSAEQALVTGLIDAVGYADEVDIYLEQKTQGATNVLMEDYTHHGLASKKTDKPAYVAYVTIEGTLMDVDAEEGFLGSGVASAESIAQAIDEAAAHERIRAILIRVNSPGGSPIAAEIIRRSIVNAIAVKPVIVSMGDTAASGGYWLSAPASAIVAQPATLTGSIGVFGGKIALNNLWNKLGVNWQDVSFGKQAGIWSTNRPYTASQQRIIEASLNRIYDNFIERVATGRHLKPEAVEKIAQGRVWTGEQALSIGLVDALGGVDKAVSITRTKANIPAGQRVQLVAFPEEESPMAQLLKFFRRGLGGSSAGVTTSMRMLQPLNALTGLNNGELAALLSPQNQTTYSFVRVR